jgi:DNA-directed RNA polymerase specialized sigma24 family protein
VLGVAVDRGGAEDARSKLATFEGLLASCAAQAYQLACSMLDDEQDAEDAVQESAVRAWTSFGHLRPGSSFRAWFLTIVANQCRSMRRAGGQTHRPAGPGPPAVGRAAGAALPVLLAGEEAG